MLRQYSEYQEQMENFLVKQNWILNKKITTVKQNKTKTLWPQGGLSSQLIISKIKGGKWNQSYTNSLRKWIKKKKHFDSFCHYDTDDIIRTKQQTDEYVSWAST